jgi:uncharacterized membrane protein (UPF0127 family)
MSISRNLAIYLITFLTASLLYSKSAEQKIEYPQLKLPQKKIVLCGQEYLAWVAQKEEDRKRGLMNFRPLKDKEAMIFVFQKEEPLSFWMKNVPFDLDIAYFNAQKKLVSYTTMKGTSPLVVEDKLPNYKSAAPAQYAVEVPAGALKGLKSACLLEFD